MKRLILFELIILFFATTFESDSPPGWYQQVLPVNDLINDIFFLDSSTGWVVTDGRTSTNDTGYIMKTTNGGNNWTVQYNLPMKLNAVQFLDANTGYVAGGSGSGTGRIFKTTNAGTNWNNIATFSTQFEDLFFVNKDTGWTADPNGFGGLFVTTNGGLNWQPQLDQSFFPRKLFFLNKDTGWVGSGQANGRLYRTTNGGTNWNLQYISNFPVESIFYLNANNGWINGGTGSGSLYTTNGGINWTNSQGNVSSAYDIKFVTDSIGFSGGSLMRVAKSTDGGKTWGPQNIPIFDALQTAFLKNDTLRGWMGTNGLIKTTDGGGPFVGIQQISNEVPNDYMLYQNYPNPFNPITNIKYTVKETSKVKLIIYDIQGKEVTTLIDQKQNTGTFEAGWNASSYPSGVYFYSLVVEGKAVETRKMILIK